MLRLPVLAGLGVLLLLPRSLPAQTSEAATDSVSVWTPDVAMRYRGITGTALSPTGRLVAYEVRTPVMDGERSEYRTHIHVAATDGTMDRAFTSGDVSCTAPAFSPDGTRLAFLSSRGEKTQVWVMPVDGGEAHVLTDAATDVGSFAWSPDGSRIAYTMRDPDTEEEQQAKKEKRDPILVDQDYKYTHLYTITVSDDPDDEPAIKRLTGGPFTVTGFDWSPDGTSIVFAHAPTPDINTLLTDQDLARVPADSGAVVPLVERPGVDANPLVSPDGTRIAFTSHGGRVERVGLSDVYVVPASGGDPVRLAETPDRNANLVGWARDGSAVYVAEAYRTTSRIYRVPMDRTEVQPIADVTGVLGDLSLRLGGLSFTFQDTDTPEDVYVTPIAAFALDDRLTDLHRKVDAPPLARTEVISWLSPDGTPVEGLLTYPAGYDPSRAYPLVLQIHGGPAGVFSQSFTGGPGIYMTQVFAQAGYAVLRPNPRGSTGYGKDFRYANVRDWGYGDYEDVMSGVDAVIDRGVAHPDSLALMGWSYGGYLTSFAVTRTDRFKVASMGAGLPNLISMVTTTDIPDYLAAHMGGEFWDDYEGYERHSAMYRIKNVTTPTQVIHGAEDERVPTDQGREFYVALKRRGVPTEMILLPRTPHGPREPKLLMEVTPRILQWFDRHLKRGSHADRTLGAQTPK